MNMTSSEMGHLHQDHVSEKSFRIKQDGKFFSRLLSKETSQPNSSCRVYYGEAAGAIPFVWESQPGTPKLTLFEHPSHPPLTPPPSYAANSNNIVSKSIHRRPSSSFSKPKLLFLSTIFHRKDAVKAGKPKTRKLSQPSSLSSLSSSSTTSSSSSWSNYSALSLNKKKVSDQRRLGWFLQADSAGCTPFDYGSAEFDLHDHEQDDQATSFRLPNSTLCFPVKKKTWDFLAHCYAVGSMKIGRRI